MDKLLSIIIPVYNTGELLKACIKSLQEQTFKNYEVILVDDGSTDCITSKLCDEIASEDRRFSVLHCSNGGVAVARNRGFEVSTSNYVMFIDGDDTLFSKNVISSINDLVKTNPDVDIIKGGYQRIQRNAEKVTYHTEADKCFNNVKEFLCANLKARCGGFTWNTVYKRSIMVENDLRMEEASMEDHIFFLKYLQHTKCALLTSTIFYNYYDNQGSVSYNPKFSAFDILDEALNERRLYKDILSLNDSESKQLIDEGLSSNINRALFKLYHFEQSRRKRKQFVEKVKRIKDFVPSLRCLTFPMPFAIRDLFLKYKYGK